MPQLGQNLELSPVVAAASIGQVYKAYIPEYGDVAIKVQRPGIRATVERDATLLLDVAAWLEGLPGPNGRLVSAKLVFAVEEFMSRLYEELDYANEARNMRKFASLYSITEGNSTRVRVVVPRVFLDTDHVIVMEWIEGTKLSVVRGDDETSVAEKLALIKAGIQCTLSQLLDTGVMHADPHAGNLMKVETRDSVELGYLDFGILSSVPEGVRDGLVCAVAQLLFNRDVEAVASLFGELQLLPIHVVQNPIRRGQLTASLSRIFDDVLRYEDSSSSDLTPIPDLRFDALLGSLVSILTNFEFQLPPYFINNARALGTMEGIARGLDPSFSVLEVVYPYALNRLLCNPSDSQVVDDTVMRLVSDPRTNLIDPKRLTKLLGDAAVLSKSSKASVLRDIVRTRGGQRILRRALVQSLQRLPGRRRSRQRQRYFQL